jgi:hypothetical protein
MRGSFRVLDEPINLMILESHSELGERHLGAILSGYAAYYNRTRRHLDLT